jgi:hypothetical protein
MTFPETTIAYSRKYADVISKNTAFSYDVSCRESKYGLWKVIGELRKFDDRTKNNFCGFKLYFETSNITYIRFLYGLGYSYCEIRFKHGATALKISFQTV